MEKDRDIVADSANTALVHTVDFAGTALVDTVDFADTELEHNVALVDKMVRGSMAWAVDLLRVSIFGLQYVVLEQLTRYHLNRHPSYKILKNLKNDTYFFLLIY